MDSLVLECVEFYNELVIKGIPTLTDTEAVESLQEKAKDNAVASFKKKLKTGTPEAQDLAKKIFQRYITSILSVWKPLAVELSKQVEHNFIDTDNTMELEALKKAKKATEDLEKNIVEMKSLRQELQQTKDEVLRLKNVKTK